MIRSHQPSWVVMANSIAGVIILPDPQKYADSKCSDYFESHNRRLLLRLQRVSI